jgi:hypothetical protein
MKHNQKILDMVSHWMVMLDIKGWAVTIEAIDKKSVIYDSEIPEEDRYYVGVQVDRDTRIATIYHDRDLTEEDIVHELLHVKYPDWTEDQVNKQTEKWLRKEN